jgi:hypothetical protein
MKEEEVIVKKALETAFVDGAFWMMRRLVSKEGTQETLKAFEEWYRRFQEGTTTQDTPL